MQTAENCKNPVTPSGIPLKNFSFVDLGAKIGFSFPKATTRPLQPLTVAQTSGDNTVRLSSIFFVDEHFNINQNNVQVIQDFSYTNDQQPYLNLYICYTDSDVKSQNYKAYRVDYTVDWDAYTINEALSHEGINLPAPAPSKITMVTSFLWDKDPVTSRGTETTVKTSL